MHLFTRTCAGLVIGILLLNVGAAPLFAQKKVALKRINTQKIKSDQKITDFPSLNKKMNNSASSKKPIIKKEGQSEVSSKAATPPKPLSVKVKKTFLKKPAGKSAVKKVKKSIPVKQQKKK